jgi:hypothetical protein
MLPIPKPAPITAKPAPIPAPIVPILPEISRIRFKIADNIVLKFEK